MMNKISKFIKENLIIGLIFSGPIFGTLYILYLIFSLLDGILGGIYSKILGFNVPGAGLISLLVLLIGVGILAKTYLASFFFKVFEETISRVPIVSSIYSAFKSLVDILQQNREGKKPFGKVVAVNLNGVYIIGYEVGREGDKSSVYIPTAPTPNSGFNLVVPTKYLIHLNLKPDDVLKFVISLGSYAHPVIKAISEYDMKNEKY